MSNQTATGPAIFLAAPASGQGKTTLTAALARLLKRQGKVVRVFKTGPDYLDPQILEQASGQPVEPLDMWMAGEEYCQQKLHEAALVADLIIVEGAMGMYDGTPSSADLAARFNIPLVVVMDVKGMAQTAAALVQGLVGFRSDISVVGMIANHCSTERHRELIAEALPEHIPLLFSVKRDETMALPERHLGLVQANEVEAELEQRFELGADCLQAAGALNCLENLPAVDFPSASLPAVEPLLKGMQVGIAKDEAFSFIYQANLALLRQMGAELQFFSPIHDAEVPAVDVLWFPGGYPELHAKALSSNTSMLNSVKAFHGSARPILAECGGFLYCLETLTDLEDDQYPMAGLIEGHGAMRGKRGCQGMQSAPLPEGTLRGHAHHRSRSANTPEPIAYGQRQRHQAPGEAIYRVGSLTASYLHLFFPSNPNAIAHLFQSPTQEVAL
ncbi:MAG: cobyrinate a,c-diamide synthase [Pseudomonadales bacterium]|nr:cobyrinate a,c-diamide synthase [Pseudomonadales bacterium]